MKYKGLCEAWRAIKSKSDAIRDKLGTIPSLDEIKNAYKEWMELFEEFMKCLDEYRQLLSEDEHLKFERDCYTDKEVWLSNVRTRIQDWMVEQKAPRSLKSSRSSKYSKASQLLIQEEQRKAELLTRQKALKERQIIEIERIKLKQREEEIDIKTVVVVLEAKCKVLEKLERTSRGSSEDKESHARGLEEGDDMNANVVVTEPKPEVFGDAGRDGERPSPVMTSETAVHWMYSFEELLDQYDIGALGIPSPQLGPRTAGTPLSHRQVSRPPQDVPDVSGVPVRHNVNGVAQSGQSKGGLPHDTTGEDKQPTKPKGAVPEIKPVGGQSLNEMIRHLQRPKLEMEKFSGEAIEFKRFMRMFNARVVKLCDTDDERLYYLEQLTTGEAHKIVTGYRYLDGTIDYAAAIKELSERYGNSEVIANAFIKKAASWPQIKIDNPKALDAFAIFLNECESAAKCVGSLQYW